MATLGYVFPRKNKEELLSEISQSVKNYKNDVLRQTFQRKPQQSIVPEIIQNIQQQPGINIDAITPKSMPSTPTRTGKTLSAVVTELINNPRFKSRQISEQSSPSSSGQVSPSVTEISTASSQQMSNYIDQLDTIKDTASRDSVNNSAYRFLIDEVKNGARIFAATGRNQKKCIDENILELRGDGLYLRNDKPFKIENLGATFKINILNPVGSGIKRDIKYNAGVANFGKFFINLNSLRNGNLAIYRPKSNIMYLNKRSISPKLVSIIQDIRQNKTFDITAYDALKESEKIIADKVINLAQVDFPAKMKRSLDELIWNLKQRYEILLGSYNAGNDGKLVTDEIKSVLKELLKHKAISKSKHDYILKAI